jgi:hypothetical protein
MYVAQIGPFSKGNKSCRVRAFPHRGPNKKKLRVAGHYETSSKLPPLSPAPKERLLGNHLEPLARVKRE